MRCKNSCHAPRIDAEAENKRAKCSLIGRNKNGAHAKIKRDSGIKETAIANTDRNAAPETAPRGRKSATEKETRPKTYTDTHTTATPRQSAKKRAPAHERSRSASGWCCMWCSIFGEWLRHDPLSPAGNH